jgi:hypothetical protein
MLHLLILDIDCLDGYLGGARSASSLGNSDLSLG